MEQTGKPTPLVEVRIYNDIVQEPKSVAHSDTSLEKGLGRFSSADHGPAHGSGSCTCTSNHYRLICISLFQQFYQWASIECSNQPQLIASRKEDNIRC